MARSAGRTFRDLGRMVIGGLVLGMPLLYTMETWWLAWRLPTHVILAFSLLGLVAVFALVDLVGFEEGDPGHDKSLLALARDFLELVLASAVTSLAVLLLFGIVEWGDSLSNVVRLTAIEIVPVGLGGAIADAALKSAEEEGDPTSFAREAGIFGLGAVFFALNVAPTDEVVLMAAHAGWTRLALVVPAAVALTYLALYELEFRGERGRAAGSASAWMQWGEATAGYVIALAASALLLAAYGHLTTPLLENVQKVVVLSFVASLGGAAARVVI